MTDAAAAVLIAFKRFFVRFGLSRPQTVHIFIGSFSYGLDESLLYALTAYQRYICSPRKVAVRTVVYWCTCTCSRIIHLVCWYSYTYLVKFVLKRGFILTLKLKTVRVRVQLVLMSLVLLLSLLLLGPRDGDKPNDKLVLNQMGS